MSTALFVLGACASDSGQTGSPASEPPEYETPGRKPPEGPGGGTNGGNGETPDSGSTPEQTLPRPAPAPGSTALIGDRLLVAARGSLAVMDVTTPTAPSLLGRLPIEGDIGMLQARSLDRVIVSAYAAPHGSYGEIPEVDVPFTQNELLQVDASDASAPSIVRRDVVPQGSAGVVVRDGGYTALGGSVENGTGTCGGAGGGTLLPDIPQQPKPVVSLWLERFGADATSGDVRREFGPGHWQLSTDQTHAIRVGSPAHTPVSGDLSLEVVNLSSLETVYSVTVGASALGAPLSLQPAADFRDGVLVVAAGPRLLAFDVATGAALLPLTTSSAIQGLRFLDAATIGLDAAGSPLARLDRQSGSPALALVPVAGGQFVGSLLPFGDGYVSLEGTGGGPAPQLLRASSYRIDETGTLALVDELQTDWYFNTYDYGTPWYVDRESARISYVMPVTDSDTARLGVIRLADGELRSSNLASIPRMPPAALVHGDAVLPFAGGLLTPVQIDEDLALEALQPTTLALDWVWFEVEHAGLIFARHRKDTGQTYLSARSSTFAEPEYISVPHTVDSLLPIDDEHLAVFGFSVDGLCDSVALVSPNEFPECAVSNGNGVTILDISGGDVRVGPTIELSSFMEGSPPEGVQRSLDWYGYLGVAPGKWALWGNFRDQCSSEASCAALGVPAYRSFGSGGCSSDQTCDPGPIEFVSGYRTASWLFVLDVTDPDAPVLEPAVREGAQLRAGGGEPQGDLERVLLGYESPDGNVWGYPHQEYVTKPDGNWVDDGHGGSLSHWYLQLLGAQDGSVSFGERVNVPGETILLAPGTGAAEHTVYTLEPRYDDGSDEQSVALVRARIENGGAFVEQRLDLGKRLASTLPTEGFIAALTAPEEYCVELTSYELRVADIRGETLTLSQPLEIPLPLSGVGWYLSGSPEPGVVELGGGPARFAGRLKVDVTTDPPAILSYEY